MSWRDAVISSAGDAGEREGVSDRRTALDCSSSEGVFPDDRASIDMHEAALEVTNESVSSPVQST
jgi:hypothetical protein